MRVLVAGSSGFVGSALVDALTRRGDEVFRLVRKDRVGPNEVSWNPVAIDARIDTAGLEGFDAMVHLGGVGIGEKRWTDKHKERLWDSRVASTELLTKAMERVTDRPKTFVCASAVGYYGSRGDDVLDESSSKGAGFLADLCDAWENTAREATQSGTRVASLRSGIVLGHGGGVMARQVPLFRLCLGGVMGNGRQFVSWISLRDEVAAILHVLDSEISGPVNLVSPNPERNVTYTKIIGHMLRRPTLIPVPRWMMTLPLGDEFTDEVLLASQRAMPAKLLESNFQFQDTHLEQALQVLLADEESARRQAKNDDANEGDDQDR